MIRFLLNLFKKNKIIYNTIFEFLQNKKEICYYIFMAKEFYKYMEILKNPWIKAFLKLCKDTNHTIRITSPYVTFNICNQMITQKKPEVQLKLISSFTMPTIYSGFLDLKAITSILKNGGIVKDHNMLHSKMYLFDEKCAVVTSGNLTYGGMKNNYEYGVMIKNAEMVQKIVKDFECLFTSKNCINKNQMDINNLECLLKHYKLYSNKIELEKNFDENSEHDFYEYLKLPSHLISSSLNGWKLEVFKLIDDISSLNFSLNDLYNSEPILSSLFPNNHNIRDKIRQQLQYLRNLGWIEFLGNGHYRKLWKNFNT